jgi:starvation-inducible DNA-binding protein
VADRDVIRQIFETVDAAVRRLRPRPDTTEKTDLVTQDLLIAITGALEESRWMWQAQNAGYQSDAPAC